VGHVRDVGSRPCLAAAIYSMATTIRGKGKEEAA